jgi:glycosyltransferase involved in cell wall biosynthesis
VPPLVSVITLAYNQEAFLPACLSSIRAQEGDFELEHIVVDDASTDGTWPLLEAYRERHPGSTTLIRNETNRGANFGMAEAYGRCRGEFVATCEGDDWWISPAKLAIQLEWMARRPDASMCYHDAVVVHESRLQWTQVKPGFGAPVQTLETLLEDNRIPTCSVLYRRIPGLTYPSWYGEFTVGDWPNHAFHAARGPIGYLPRPLAAYRVHDRGSWSAKRIEDRAHEIAGMLGKLDAHFLFRHSDRIRETIGRVLAEVPAASQAA